MTHYTKFAAPMALAVAMAMSSASFAQAPKIAPKDPAPARPTATVTADKAKDWEYRHRASKIIGANVQNRQGENLGDIEDIVLDRQGNIAYAVVSTGGFLGIGERLHAMPWKALQPRLNEPGFILDIDRKRLQAAPGFQRNAWPNFDDERWTKDNLRAYPAR